MAESKSSAAAFVSSGSPRCIYHVKPVFRVASASISMSIDANSVYCVSARGQVRYVWEAVELNMAGGKSDAENGFSWMQRLSEDVRCQRKAADIVEHLVYFTLLANQAANNPLIMQSSK